MNIPHQVVDIRGLRFAYGGRPVLRGVDLQIPAGKIVAILGASGSGKTTLLQLIGGLAQARGRAGAPSAGATCTTSTTPRALRAAPPHGDDVPEGRALQRPDGVREHRLPDPRAHEAARGADPRPGADEAATRSGCAAPTGCMPDELSGGMSRRVALARAIALDPELIIYDEPFAGLDPITLNVDLQPDPHAERRARRHLRRRHLRRARSDAARRLPLPAQRRRDRRARPHEEMVGLEGSLRAPVPARRARRPGALPLSRPAPIREELEMSATR